MPPATIELDADALVDVHAKVFRLFTRDGGVACTRDLWVRFDWGPEGWAASFWGKFGGDHAAHGYKPLTAIPGDVADLAAKAMRMLDKLQASGKKGTDKFTVQL